MKLWKPVLTGGVPKAQLSCTWRACLPPNFPVMELLGSGQAWHVSPPRLASSPWPVAPDLPACLWPVARQTSSAAPLHCGWQSEKSLLPCLCFRFCSLFFIILFFLFFSCAAISCWHCFACREFYYYCSSFRLWRRWANSGSENDD